MGTGRRSGDKEIKQQAATNWRTRGDREGGRGLTHGSSPRRRGLDPCRWRPASRGGGVEARRRWTGAAWGSLAQSQGGSGCVCVRRTARGREGSGVGQRRRLGRAVSMARIRIPSLVSGPFKLGYADTSRIRIRRVSVSDMSPTRDTRLPWRIRVSELNAQILMLSTII